MTHRIWVGLGALVFAGAAFFLATILTRPANAQVLGKPTSTFPHASELWDLRVDETTTGSINTPSGALNAMVFDVDPDSRGRLPAITTVTGDLTLYRRSESGLYYVYLTYDASVSAPIARFEPGALLPPGRYALPGVAISGEERVLLLGFLALP